MRFLIVLLLILFLGCTSSHVSKLAYPAVGVVEKLDPALDEIIRSDAKAEVIADGLDWSEGPVWVESEKMLLFSDVPRDTIFKWTEKRGKEVYLTPSGLTLYPARGGEMGSNGLALSADNKLILCQCGNRQLAMMDASVGRPSAKYLPLADNYEGKKFNSPNDLVVGKSGEIYFTDPPYGLERGMKDEKKEIPFQGVYAVGEGRGARLITSALTRPNGIGLFPDGRLLVANSDPSAPNWYVIDNPSSPGPHDPKIFYSLAGYDRKLKGSPDGLKIDSKGNVIATGPGGLYFFNKDAKLLGKMYFNGPVSNVALSPDEKTIYMTKDMYILRLKMR